METVKWDLDGVARARKIIGNYDGSQKDRTRDDIRQGVIDLEDFLDLCAEKIAGDTPCPPRPKKAKEPATAAALPGMSDLVAPAP